MGRVLVLHNRGMIKLIGIDRKCYELHLRPLKEGAKLTFLLFELPSDGFYHGLKYYHWCLQIVFHQSLQ